MKDKTFAFWCDALPKRNAHVAERAESDEESSEANVSEISPDTEGLSRDALSDPGKSVQDDAHGTGEKAEYDQKRKLPRFYPLRQAVSQSLGSILSRCLWWSISPGGDDGAEGLVELSPPHLPLYHLDYDSWREEPAMEDSEKRQMTPGHLSASEL